MTALKVITSGLKGHGAHVAQRALALPASLAAFSIRAGVGDHIVRCQWRACRQQALALGFAGGFLDQAGVGHHEASGGVAQQAWRSASGGFLIRAGVDHIVNQRRVCRPSRLAGAGGRAGVGDHYCKTGGAHVAQQALALASAGGFRLSRSGAGAPGLAVERLERPHPV